MCARRRRARSHGARSRARDRRRFGSSAAPAQGLAVQSARRLEDKPKTLEQLSKVYDISRERVRQIEVRAFEKVEKAVKAAMAETLPVEA